MDYCMLTIEEAIKNKEVNLLQGQIKGLSELLSYKNSWESLTEEFPHPLLDANWFIAGSKGFSSTSLLNMFIVYSEHKQLKAIAPLASKGKILPHLEILGSSILREPGGFLYDDIHSLQLLIKRLLASNEPLFLSKLYQNSAEVKLIETEIKDRNSVIVDREYSRIPFVDTKKDWDSIKRNTSSSKRSNFRRLNRKIEKKGKVNFQVISPNQDNFKSYLNDLMKVEASNWKGKMGTAIKTHEALRDFFTELAYLMASESKLRLIFLTVDETPIAAQFAIEHSNRLWILKIGYDERWSHFSPGTLLMDKVVKYCFDEGLESCEFLGNNDDWLHDWATGVHELISYNIYPKTFNGILTKYRDQLAVSYHALVNHLKYKWVFR